MRRDKRSQRSANPVLKCPVEVYGCFQTCDGKEVQYMAVLALLFATIKQATDQLISLPQLCVPRREHDHLSPLILVRVGDEHWQVALLDRLLAREVLLECAMQKIDAPLNRLSDDAAALEE